MLDGARAGNRDAPRNAFDNRYQVSLPPGEALVGAGIHRVLYLSEAGAPPPPDVRDAVWAWSREGIETKAVALSDFAPRPLDEWPLVPVCATGVTVARPPADAAPVWFGGLPESESCFWWWYGWAQATASGVVMAPLPPRRLAPRTLPLQAPPATPAAQARTAHGGGARRSKGSCRGGGHP